MPKSSLDKLLSATPQLWKGKRRNHSQRTLTTGHQRLDDHLPGRGWPLGAITELLSDKPGLGELSLLFPALAELGQQGQWLILVDPPWIPYPASLHGRGLPLDRMLVIRTKNEKESLWACEQAFRGNRGGAVLAWPHRINFARLRRLQLAAEENAKLAFLFRPERVADGSSPAALRLKVFADEEQDTWIRILKCRGNRPTDAVRIAPSHRMPFEPDPVLYDRLPSVIPGPGARRPGRNDTHALLHERSLPGPASIN